MSYCIAPSNVPVASLFSSVPLRVCWSLCSYLPVCRSVFRTISENMSRNSTILIFALRRLIFINSRNHVLSVPQCLAHKSSSISEIFCRNPTILIFALPRLIPHRFCLSPAVMYEQRARTEELGPGLLTSLIANQMCDAQGAGF